MASERQRLRNHRPLREVPLLLECIRRGAWNRHPEYQKRAALTICRIGGPEAPEPQPSMFLRSQNARLDSRDKIRVVSRSSFSFVSASLLCPEPLVMAEIRTHGLGSRLTTITTTKLSEPNRTDFPLSSCLRTKLSAGVFRLRFVFRSGSVVVVHACLHTLHRGPIRTQQDSKFK